MEQHRSQKKVGRPSKGLRHETRVRTPMRLHEAVVARAKELNMTVTDYYLHLAELDTHVPAYPQTGLVMDPRTNRDHRSRAAEAVDEEAQMAS